MQSSSKVCKLLYSYPSFSILQWNQLNSSLATISSFPQIDPLNLDWNYRKNLIINELDSFSSSIVCLEEVDQIDFYLSYFSENNYKVLYNQKNGGTKDYLILAYKVDCFILEKYEYLNYDSEIEGQKDSQIAIIANLFLLNKGIKTDKNVIVTVTHLKAKANFENTRKNQVNQLIKKLFSEEKKFLDKNDKNNSSFILCGDFNAEPNSDSIKKIKNLEFFNLAYDNCDFTTFKVREDKEYCRVIDYIFYSKKLSLICKGILPNKQEIGEKGLPNNFYPSDHLPLFGIFKFDD